jgi:hypothetical protein
MSTLTLKSYNLSSVNSNLELGKRGGMIKYDFVNSKFTFYESDKTTLAPIQIGDAVNNDEALTKGQLSESLKAVSSVGSYNVISTSITLSTGVKYYLTSNQTLTLPATSNVSVGESLTIRSSNAITSSTLNVDDSVTEAIITTAGSSSSFTLDTMTEITIVYSGSGDWELLINA